MGTKQNPGKFDCYEAAEPDEPMFVLLARDPLAPDLVHRWANSREAQGGNPEKVAEARHCAYEMTQWRVRERPDGAALVNLVRSIADSSPFFDVEYGARIMEACVFCNKYSNPDADDATFLTQHEDGCVWVQCVLAADKLITIT